MQTILNFINTFKNTENSSKEMLRKLRELNPIIQESCDATTIDMLNAYLNIFENRIDNPPPRTEEEIRFYPEFTYHRHLKQLYSEISRIIHDRILIGMLFISIKNWDDDDDDKSVLSVIQTQSNIVLIIQPNETRFACQIQKSKKGIKKNPSANELFDKTASIILDSIIVFILNKRINPKLIRVCKNCYAWFMSKTNRERSFCSAKCCADDCHKRKKTAQFSKERKQKP